MGILKNDWIWLVIGWLVIDGTILAFDWIYRKTHPQPPVDDD